MYGANELSKSTLIPIPPTPSSNCWFEELCPIPSPKKGTNTVLYGVYPAAVWNPKLTSLPLG